MRERIINLQPVMRVFLTLPICALLVFFSATLTHAETASKKVEKEVEKVADEADPCAEDNKNYPWGMSPCKEFQIKKKWGSEPAIPGQGRNKNVPILKK